MSSVVGGRKKKQGGGGGPIQWPQPREVEDDHMSLATTIYNLGPGAWFRGGGGGGDRSVVGFVPGDNGGTGAPNGGQQRQAVAWSQPRTAQDNDDLVSLATFEYSRSGRARRTVETTGPRKHKRWTKSMATNVPPGTVSASEREAIKSLLPHVPPGYMIVKDPYAPTIPSHNKNSVIFEVLRANLPPGYGIVKLAPEGLEAGARSTAKGSAKKKELTYFRGLFFKGKMGQQPSTDEEIKAAAAAAAAAEARPETLPPEAPSPTPAPPAPPAPVRPANFDSTRDISDREIEHVESASLFSYHNNNKTKEGGQQQSQVRRESDKKYEQKVQELHPEPTRQQQHNRPSRNYHGAYDESLADSKDQQRLPQQRSEYSEDENQVTEHRSNYGNAYTETRGRGGEEDDYAYGSAEQPSSYASREQDMASLTSTVQGNVPAMPETCRFLYYRVDASGRVIDGACAPGSFDGAALNLGTDTRIPVENIVGAEGGCCLIVEATIPGSANNEATNLHVLKIRNGGSKWTAEDLCRQINRFASYGKALRVVDSLGGERDAGVVGLACPCCSSTIILSKVVNTPQIYCGYCKSVFMRGRDVPSPEERSLRVCALCKFYGQVEDFEYRYFWVGLGSVNWQSNRRRICHGCIRQKAQKAFAANIPCIVGIPSGVGALADASRRQKSASPGSLQIEKANAILKREKRKNSRQRNEESIHEAMEIYRALIRSKEISAELHYNLGRAYLIRQDFENAISSLEASLADCGNYQPAIDILLVCYGLTNANPMKAMRLKERLRYSHTTDFGEIAGQKRARSSSGCVS